MSLKPPIFLLLVGVAAEAQTARVSGVVVDERQTPVAGATVRLTGDRSVTVGANGRFEFADAIPGRYVITVTSIGFQLRSVDLTVTRDTTLRIVMTRRSVTLDTVIVRPRNLRVKATAVDASTGDFLLQAQATLYPGARFMGAVSGVFVFDSVSPGPTSIVVEALEHLPVRVDIALMRDSVFRVPMEVDSVALRMTAMQVRRLEQRSHSIAMPTTSLNRDAIKREGVGNLFELLMRRSFEDPAVARQLFINTADSGCFFVDDNKVPFQALEGMVPELVERIEIYRSGGAEAPTFQKRPFTKRNFGVVRMVRVYTRRFVATLPRQEKLPRIVFMGTGLRPTCT